MNEPNAPLRVMHVITNLDVGGAEVMLTRVLPKLAPYQVTSEVVCLSDGGPLVETLRAGGSNVICVSENARVLRLKPSV